MSCQGLELHLLVDATPMVGAGHAMRLATLAEAWIARGGLVRVSGDITLEFVVRRFADLGIESGNPAKADVLTVDSYDPGIRFRAGQGSDRVVRVLVDDVGAQVPSGFDLVWNPNPYGGRSFYPGFQGPVLSGPDHVPVRSGLPTWQHQRDEIVVTLGGGLASRQIILAIHQLAELMPDQAFATTGTDKPAAWRLIPADGLWQEAAGAKAMVTAAGGTVWEAAFVGIPVVVLQIADNQRLVYRWTRDAAVPGLNALMVDADFLAHQLRALLAAARPLPAVANGADRVVATVARLIRDRRAA